MLFTSRQGSGLTRRQVYNIFEKCAAKAGIEAGRRNPHLIAKHSLASHLIRNGVSVAHLQQILGHRDAKSTLAYTNISQTEGAEVQSRTLNTIFA
jgi:site-specific recombinase XerD